MQYVQIYGHNDYIIHNYTSNYHIRIILKKPILITTQMNVYIFAYSRS